MADLLGLFYRSLLIWRHLRATGRTGRTPGGGQLPALGARTDTGWPPQALQPFTLRERQLLPGRYGVGLSSSLILQQAGRLVLVGRLPLLTPLQSSRPDVFKTTVTYNGWLPPSATSVHQPSAHYLAYNKSLTTGTLEHSAS